MRMIIKNNDAIKKLEDKQDFKKLSRFIWRENMKGYSSKQKDDYMYIDDSY